MPSSSESFGCISLNAACVSLEGLAMLGDELFKRHRRTAAELLDVVIRAREDAVLVVDHDVAEVLEDEIIPRESLAALSRSSSVAARRVVGFGPSPFLNLELLEADLLVFDLPPQHPVEDLGDLRVAVLDRAEQRVNLAAMRRGVFEDARDHTPLGPGRRSELA